MDEYDDEYFSDFDEDGEELLHGQSKGPNAQVWKKFKNLFYFLLNMWALFKKTKKSAGVNQASGGSKKSSYQVKNASNKLIFSNLALINYSK